MDDRPPTAVGRGQRPRSSVTDRKGPNDEPSATAERTREPVRTQRTQQAVRPLSQSISTERRRRSAAAPDARPMATRRSDEAAGIARLAHRHDRRGHYSGPAHHRRHDRDHANTHRHARRRHDDGLSYRTTSSAAPDSPATPKSNQSTTGGSGGTGATHGDYFSGGGADATIYVYDQAPGFDAYVKAVSDMKDKWYSMSDQELLETLPTGMTPASTSSWPSAQSSVT